MPGISMRRPPCSTVRNSNAKPMEYSTAFLTLSPGPRLRLRPKMSLTTNAPMSARKSQRIASAPRRAKRTEDVSGLVGLLVPQDANDRQRENLEVEEGRPATQVFQVVVDARLHVFHTRGFAPASVDLRKTGDARGRLVTDHVALDELAIF